jgi:hypothetical protein
MRGFKSDDRGRGGGRSDDYEPVEFEDVECVGATPRAIRVRLADGTQHWIPQSQITPMSEVYELGNRGRLIVSRWFARKEGLV